MQATMRITQCSAVSLAARPARTQALSLRAAVAPRRSMIVRADTGKQVQKEAEQLGEDAKDAANELSEKPKEVADKVQENLPSNVKSGGSIGDQVDEVGREVSKFTQETSGLTLDNTTKPSGGDKPDFTEAMSFSGQVPERANSRLAMLAFAAAAGAELATGAPVAAQLKKSPILIGATFLIFIAASIIPIVRGEDPNKESGPFTVRAELWNGRLAMLGFIALLLTETFKSGPAI